MKGSALRKARRIVAAVVFALALLAFVDFRDAVPPRWIAGVASIQLVPSLLRALAGIGAAGFLLWLIVTLLAGRIYCSAVCPLGIFQDLVWHVRRKLSPQQLKFQPEKKFLRFGILLAVAGSCAGGGWVTLSMFDPYSIFGRAASGIFRPAAIGLNNTLVPAANALGLHSLHRVTAPSVLTVSAGFSLLILAVVAVMAAWRGRLFCNALCPVGSFLGLFSKKAAFRLQIDKSLCQKCGDCLQACKAECIDLRSQEIDFSRCVACYDCLAVCDQQGIRYRASDKPECGTQRDGPEMPADLMLRNNLKVIFLGLTSFFFPATLTAKDKGHHEEKHEKEGGEEKGGRHERHGRHEEHAGQGAPILPPGAVSLERFLSRCTACGLCVAKCPTQVLQPAFLEYGWRGIFKPRLDPRAGYCNFDCTICGDVCPTGALASLPLERKQRTQLGEARFHKGHCIVHTEGTDCAACAEHCPTKAVDTVPYRGNLLLPKVDESLCIGCGACESVCPVRPERAIRVSGKSLQTTLPPAAPAAARPPAAQANEFPF